MTPEQKRQLDQLRQLEAREAAAGPAGRRQDKQAPLDRLQEQFDQWRQRVRPDQEEGEPSAAERWLFDAWITDAMVDLAKRSGLGIVPTDLSVDDLMGARTGEKPKEDEDNR